MVNNVWQTEERDWDSQAFTRAEYWFKAEQKKRKKEKKEKGSLKDAREMELKKV